MLRMVVPCIAVSVILSAAPAHSATPAVAWVTQATSDGHVLLTVTNEAASPITALAAVGSRTLLASGATDRSVRFFDSALNPFGPKSIPPGGTYTFTFFGPRPAPRTITRSVELDAAVFQDGSSWGDSEWVNKLLLRRSSAYNYSLKVLHQLQDASSTGSSRQMLEQALVEGERSDFASAGTIEEKQMVQAAYEDTLLIVRNTTGNQGNADASTDMISRARARLLLRTRQLFNSRPAIEK